jgi:ketosteroid isomerase-like protein
VTEAENIEVVKAVVNAWNENDWDAVEARVAPDAVMVAPEGWSESGQRKGWRAIREQIEDVKAPWSEERLDPVECRAAGTRVFLQVHWITVGEASGVSVETDMFSSYELAGGVIRRLEFFPSRNEALAATGIVDT